MECPLCMENLDIDDRSFYPCSCGYQICRFCWHRLRSSTTADYDSNQCPACRKPYADHPANFKPISTQELLKHRNEKKKRSQVKSKSQLAELRVVQKNLIFVVGLSCRIGDVETLKKQEYFGRFGRIVKVVVNTSGGQGTSAYITYSTPSEALRAITSVNNQQFDGRTIKVNLGTTKYCSHFLKNQACPKTECMYLHSVGESEASFTKEDMLKGKHTEYERGLVEEFLAKVKGGKEQRQPIVAKTPPLSNSNSEVKTQQMTQNPSPFQKSQESPTPESDQTDNLEDGENESEEFQGEADMVEELLFGSGSQTEPNFSQSEASRVSQSETVNTHFNQSEAINTHFSQSDAINTHFSQSEAINTHFSQLESSRQNFNESEAIAQNFSQAEASRLNFNHSEPITQNFNHSEPPNLNYNHGFNNLHHQLLPPPQNHHHQPPLHQFNQNCYPQDEETTFDPFAETQKAFEELIREESIRTLENGERRGWASTTSWGFQGPTTAAVLSSGQDQIGLGPHLQNHQPPNLHPAPPPGYHQQHPNPCDWMTLDPAIIYSAPSPRQPAQSHYSVPNRQQQQRFPTAGRIGQPPPGFFY